MKNIFLALLLSLAGNVYAQVDFGYSSDRDTILPIFATDSENLAYAYLLGRPQLPLGWKVLSGAPLSLSMWSEKAGWDIIVFDPAESTVKGFRYDFSGEALELAGTEVREILTKIIAFKEKSPR